MADGGGGWGERRDGFPLISVKTPRHPTHPPLQVGDPPLVHRAVGAAGDDAAVVEAPGQGAHLRGRIRLDSVRFGWLALVRIGLGSDQTAATQA